MNDPSNDDPGGRVAMTTARASVQMKTIGSDQAGRRLDNVLMSVLKGAPRSLIYKLVRSGQVRVNGGRAKPDYRVAEGDTVRIPPVNEPAAVNTTIPTHRLTQIEAAIVFEDERLLVINKPAGLACHRGSGLGYGVIEIARALRPRTPRLDLGHRLDRETSGCLVLSKDLATLRSFHAALRDRDTCKYYTALVRGQVPVRVTRIEAALESRHKNPGERRTNVSNQGKLATTVIEDRQRCGAHSLLTLRLETGRMHQIRAHARHIGHPVAGDREYGDNRFNSEMKALGLGRMFLHATRLSLVADDLRIDVQAPLPEALAVVAQRVRDG